MSSTLSPNEVVVRLAQLSRLLDNAQGELELADENAVRARQRYEVTYARAFLEAEASNAETKKQKAVLEAADAKLDAEIADQQVRALRSRIQVLRDQVHVGQSIGAAKRSEWAAS
jgi:hypothetical protein